MTIVVEDGTGLSTAETYITVAAFKAYCDARGMSYSAYTDANIEAALRKATDYLDSKWRFKGVRLVSTQALSFPRSDLTDLDGYAVTGLPARLKAAESELTFRALSADLYEDMDRSGMVKSETVGPISTTYVDGAPAGKLFTIADRLLSPYTIKDGLRMGVPINGQTEQDPYFAAGMQDAPGTSPAADED